MAGIKDCKVTIKLGQDKKEIWCEKGTTLMNVLNENSIFIDAPCGGKGLCGKCKVKVKDCLTKPTDEEMSFLSNKEGEQGYRLACVFKVTEPIEIEIMQNKDTAQIVTKGIKYDIDVETKIVKQYIVLDVPTIEDQRDDLTRMKEKLSTPGIYIPLHLVDVLTETLRNNDFSITVVHDRKMILAIEAGDTTKDSYGIAVDIGTTTVAVYIMNLVTGKQIDVISELNSQKTYGADVISRINYTMENINGLRQLKNKIVGQLNNMIKVLSERNSINKENIYQIMIAGNTTMLHFFLGISPRYIASAPFIPVLTERMEYLATEVGIDINNSCIITIIPSISAYVGADIVSGIISSGINEEDEICLLIDIGTNGEMAIGNKNGVYCCSTAAGPAFEGASIRNGVGGVAGAINGIMIEEGELKYTTISDKQAIGICGSAIIDIIAMLLENGIIDETGRFNEEDDIKSEIGIKLSDRIKNIDGQLAFIITENTLSGEVIAITQKDIREIQLAKAAIAAGINILAKSSVKSTDEISKVFLAGGFGSYINKESAVKIGLIPKVLEQKITVLGNAAGTGAQMCLISHKKLMESDKVKCVSKYIELSSSPEFQTEYIDCMYF